MKIVPPQECNDRRRDVETYCHCGSRDVVHQCGGLFDEQHGRNVNDHAAICDHHFEGTINHHGASYDSCSHHHDPTDHDDDRATTTADNPCGTGTSCSNELHPDCGEWQLLRAGRILLQCRSWNVWDCWRRQEHRLQ